MAALGDPRTATETARLAQISMHTTKSPLSARQQRWPSYEERWQPSHIALSSNVRIWSIASVHSLDFHTSHIEKRSCLCELAMVPALNPYSPVSEIGEEVIKPYQEPAKVDDSLLQLRAFHVNPRPNKRLAAGKPLQELSDHAKALRLGLHSSPVTSSLSAIMCPSSSTIVR